MALTEEKVVPLSEENFMYSDEYVDPSMFLGPKALAEYLAGVLK